MENITRKANSCSVRYEVSRILILNPYIFIYFRSFDIDNFTKSILWELEKDDGLLLKGGARDYNKNQFDFEKDQEIDEIPLTTFDNRPIEIENQREEVKHGTLTRGLNNKQDPNNNNNNPNAKVDAGEKEWKKKKKEEKLNKIKNQLNKLKTGTPVNNNTKDEFEKVLSELENYKVQTHKETKGGMTTGGALNNKKNHSIIHEVDENSERDDISEKPAFKELSSADKINVKKRMINFKMKVFDKLDIKKLITYWMDNMKFLQEKKKDRTINKPDESKFMNKKDKEEKKKEKTDSNVKYDFKRPENEITKIIPFCNNIFSIQKNET